jgi:DNA modification methylase
MNEIKCCDYLELLQGIPDESVGLVLSDPPFGISYSNPYTKNRYDQMLGDDKHFDYSLLAKEAFRILKPNSAIFLFTCWSEYPKHFEEVRKAGFRIKEPVISQKRPSGNLDVFGSFQSNADWVLFAHKGRFEFRQTNLVKNKRAGTVPNKGRKPVPEFKLRLPSCWFGNQYPFSSENPTYQKKHELYHPTIKGAKFLEWLIRLSTDEGDVVVDPFVGTGSTAIAAKRSNRHYICGDISSEYCQMAWGRITSVVY